MSIWRILINLMCIVRCPEQNRTNQQFWRISLIFRSIFLRKCSNIHIYITMNLHSIRTKTFLLLYKDSLSTYKFHFRLIIVSAKTFSLTLPLVWVENPALLRYLESLFHPHYWQREQRTINFLQEAVTKMRVSKGYCLSCISWWEKRKRWKSRWDAGLATVEL